MIFMCNFRLLHKSEKGLKPIYFDKEFIILILERKDNKDFLLESFF